MAETSYGSQDPQYAATIGYRSGSVSDVGAGLSPGAKSEVSYNGFEFPPTSQVQVTVVQEYDDPKRTVKYLTIALTVTCVVTTIDINTDIYKNTDDIMDFIRTRLSANGQPLVINNIGLGNLVINPVAAIFGSFSDVDYGPKPQVQEMKPIAGQRAVNLIWLCTTRIPACSNLGASSQGIVQSYYSIEFNEDVPGITTRTISGKVEQSRIRPPNSPAATGNNQIARRDLLTGVQNLNNEVNRIMLVFPPIGGYKRTFTQKLSAGFAVLDYTIMDTQYPSDYPMFPPVIEANITQSLFSKYLDQGFRQWNITFSGTLTVPKAHDGRHSTLDLKKEAWTWLGLFIIERLSRAKDKKYRTKKDGSNEKPTGNVFHIPISIQVTDEIYTNSFSFTFKFLLMAGTDILFAATGLFDAADLPTLKWDAHRNRLTQLSASKHNANIPSQISRLGDATIIDLCNFPSQETGSSQADGTPKRGMDLIAEVLTPDKDKSIVDYKNEFTMDMDCSTLFLKPLGEFKPLQEKTEKDSEKKKETTFTPSPVLREGQESSGNPPLVILRQTKPTYRVTMRGHAVRMGFAIDAPNLQVYAGRKVFKERDRVHESKLAIGALQRLGSGEGTTTLYRLDWEKTYVLEDSPDINRNSAPEHDGHPETYV